MPVSISIPFSVYKVYFVYCVSHYLVSLLPRHDVGPSLHPQAPALLSSIAHSTSPGSRSSSRSLSIGADFAVVLYMHQHPQRCCPIHTHNAILHTMPITPPYMPKCLPELATPPQLTRQKTELSMWTKHIAMKFKKPPRNYQVCLAKHMLAGYYSLQQRCCLFACSYRSASTVRCHMYSLGVGTHAINQPFVTFPWPSRRTVGVALFEAKSLCDWRGGGVPQVSRVTGGTPRCRLDPM